MIKYVVSSVVTAIVVVIVMVVTVNTNEDVARMLTGQKNAEQLSSDLASNESFIASVQDRIATNGLDGTKGDKGDKGDTGSSGATGSAGARGNSGTDGTAGTTGEDGATGIAGSEGAAGVQGVAGATGATGVKGDKGETGATGLQGLKGDTGATGAQGIAGVNGQDGADGTTYVIDGQGLQEAATVLSLELDGSTLTKSASGLRINSILSGQWDTAYTWGDHAAAGYVRAAGAAGGQTLVGGTNANNMLTLQANSAASGNTTTNGGIQFLVGNSGATTAMTILSNGNVGVGTTLSYGKLNINGAIATTSEGDIFSQRDTSSNATYPVIARYNDTSSTVYDGGTFIFGSGANAWVGIEKPGGDSINRLRVSATTSAFKGNIAVTTDGATNIVPFQFAQVTGLADNPLVTSFGGNSYSVADWNPAVIGFSNGGGCGSDWTNATSLKGFKYWWENNSGNWRLSIDMSGPGDSCNSVQVMFVRKEFSSRAGFGF